MKKIMCIGLAGVLAAVMLIGCSGSSVKLGEYKGVTYTPGSAEVTDEEVDEAVQSSLTNYASLNSVDRSAQNGDTVNIDFVGKMDGEAFDGGSAQGYSLTLGSGLLIDGFESGLVGASKGDQVTLELQFPDPYPNNTELSGKPVTFEVTVNDVQESVTPELNLDFVTSYSDFTTVEEYVADVRKRLEENKAAAVKQQAQTDIFTKVMDGSEITVSDKDIQKSYDELHTLYEQMATMYGLTLETMISYIGTDMATFEEGLKQDAETDARQRAVINAIAKKEGIKVEDADRQAMADDLGYASVDAMNEATGADMVDENILITKVLDFLLENAVAE